jgi:ribosomal protein S27E
MKKLIFVLMVLLIPLVFAYSQDDKSDTKREAQLVKIILKEVTCPDCQGTGWIYTLNYLNSTGVKYASSASNGNANRGSELTTIAKVVCPYCGGRKTVFLEYKIY